MVDSRCNEAPLCDGETSKRAAPQNLNLKIIFGMLQVMRLMQMCQINSAGGTRRMDGCGKPTFYHKRKIPLHICRFTLGRFAIVDFLFFFTTQQETMSLTKQFAHEILKYALLLLLLFISQSFTALYADRRHQQTLFLIAM